MDCVVLCCLNCVASLFMCMCTGLLKEYCSDIFGRFYNAYRIGMGERLLLTYACMCMG